MDQATNALQSLPLQIALLGLGLSVLRPMGLVFGFMVFGWAFGPANVVMRTVIALGLSMPVFAVVLPIMPELAGTMNIFLRVSLSAKEFAIGFLFGLLASLPFYALQGAGNLVDSYRGEASPSFPAGDSDTVTTTSLLFLVVALLTFFANGGMWFLMEGFYRTYQVWSIAAVTPDLGDFHIGILLDLIQSFLGFVLRVGLPLLALMVIVEFTVIVGARFAQNFKLETNVFLFKNVVFLFALPLYATVLVRISDETLDTGTIASLLFRGGAGP